MQQIQNRWWTRYFLDKEELNGLSKQSYINSIRIEQMNVMPIFLIHQAKDCTQGNIRKKRQDIIHSIILEHSNVLDLYKILEKLKQDLNGLMLLLFCVGISHIVGVKLNRIIKVNQRVYIYYLAIK